MSLLPCVPPVKAFNASLGKCLTIRKLWCRGMQASAKRHTFGIREASIFYDRALFLPGNAVEGRCSCCDRVRMKPTAIVYWYLLIRSVTRANHLVRCWVPGPRSAVLGWVCRNHMKVNSRRYEIMSLLVVRFSPLGYGHSLPGLCRRRVIVG